MQKLYMPAEYTLSIIPSGKVYTRLHKTIEQSAEKYGAPVFEPHITLLSDILLTKNEIMEKSEMLARMLRPFRVRLSKPGYMDSYFKCVFLLADETPELMEAGRKAREMFNKPDKRFMPHISLLYGEYPEDTKKRVISEIGKLEIEFNANSFWMVYSSNNIPVEQWHRIREFKFKG